MGERRGACRVLAGKLEGKRPLGKPKRKWEDNIEMYLQKVGWVTWIDFIWLRIWTGGGFLLRNKPSASITRGEFLD
jgi:hypothetical protein